MAALLSDRVRAGEGKKERSEHGRQLMNLRGGAIAAKTLGLPKLLLGTKRIHGA